jgi:hypothetical protein
MKMNFYIEHHQKQKFPKSSEVTEKSPMSYEGFTAQINNQNFCEVVDSASAQEIKTTISTHHESKELKDR